MSDYLMVKCSCGREYNAGNLDRCPACGTPSRGASPLAVAESAPLASTGRAATMASTSHSASIEQRMLAELEKQTSALRAIRWAVWGVGFIILVAVYLVGVKVNR